MSWFHNDRRREDRAAGEAKARRLTELYQELMQAVGEVVAEDTRVAAIVFQLAMLDVRAETTVTVELGYEPWRGPTMEQLGTAVDAAGATAANDWPTMGQAGATRALEAGAVPLVDDADRVRLRGMGVRTEQ